MPNPITDELSDEVKAELAAHFRELALRFPPRRHTVPANAMTMRELFNSRGW